MTPFQEVLDRMASATSVIRTRTEHSERLQRHGDGSAAADQLRRLIGDLERIAADLEGRR